LYGTTQTGWRINNSEVDHCGSIPTPQFNGGLHFSGILGKLGALIIEYCMVHHNGISYESDHGIYFDETPIIVRYTRSYSNAGAGIKMYTCVNPQVYYNLIYSNNLGIVYQAASTGGKIWNNVIYSNVDAGPDYGWGIVINQADTVLAELKNNIIMDNLNSSTGRFNIYVGDPAVITSSENNLIFNTAGGNVCTYQDVAKSWAQWKALGFDTAGVNANPLFVSTVTPDFHLQSTSPAINAGVDVGLTLDYDGIAVPKGSGFDIGAYEFFRGKSWVLKKGYIGSSRINERIN
jgi:hypothetical protein